MTRHGLRREAKRHTAFTRTILVNLNHASRPLESGVAAPLSHRLLQNADATALPPACAKRLGDASSPLALSHTRKKQKGSSTLEQ